MLKKNIKTLQPELGEKLARARHVNGWTLEDASEKIGVGKSAINNYERGLNQPSVSVLFKMAHFYGVSADTLLGLRKLNTESEYSGKFTDYKTVLLNDLNSQELKKAHLEHLAKLELPHFVVSARAQAGVMSPYFEEEWREECEPVKLPGIEGPAFLLDVIGDSMEPLFTEADKAVVVPMEDERELTMNRLVAVVTGGSGVYLKILRAHIMSGGIRLGSLNRIYPDITLDKEEYYKIYLVVAKWSTKLGLDGTPMNETPEITQMHQMMLDMQARLRDLESK